MKVHSPCLFHVEKKYKVNRVSKREHGMYKVSKEEIKKYKGKRYKLR